MAYVFGFPKDVTELLYSMRDGKNWNLDKTKKAATRDCANWYPRSRSAYNPGMTVVRYEEEYGLPNPPSNWVGASWHVIATDRHGDSIPEHYIQYFHEQDRRTETVKELFFTCEPCEFETKTLHGGFVIAA